VARLLNTDDLKALEANKDIHIEQTLMQGTTYMGLSTNDPILGNPKVREAFRYLIDYDGLASTILPYKGKRAPVWCLKVHSARSIARRDSPSRWISQKPGNC